MSDRYQLDIKLGAASTPLRRELRHPDGIRVQLHCCPAQLYILLDVCGHIRLSVLLVSVCQVQVSRVS